jgi:excisionase family DNA binding protein
MIGNLLTAQQAAERLGVSFWTVYRLARSGRLASVQLGRRRLFAERDLDDLVQRTRREVRMAVAPSEAEKPQ